MLTLWTCSVLVFTLAGVGGAYVYGCWVGLREGDQRGYNRAVAELWQ